MKKLALIIASILTLSCGAQALTEQPTLDFGNKCDRLIDEYNQDIKDLKDLISEIKVDLGKKKLKKCKKAERQYERCSNGGNSVREFSNGVVISTMYWNPKSGAQCSKELNKTTRKLGKNGSADCEDFISFRIKLKKLRARKKEVQQPRKKSKKCFPDYGSIKPQPAL